MLVAAAVLFYVSYWLLSKIEVAKWNAFVKGRLEGALSTGSSFTLASVAFLAVYREGFETILFYKALLTSAGGGGTPAVAAGLVLGAVALVGVYLAIKRFGVKIPLRPFFAVTSAMLYYMAFVFAGKGVAAFQEGGLVRTTVLEWAPRIPVFGIYPTAESLALQGLLVALLLFAIVWLQRRRFIGVEQRRCARPQPRWAGGARRLGSCVSAGPGAFRRTMIATPASATSRLVTCATDSGPKIRSSFARTNSMRKRSTPASTRYTPKRHPMACLWVRNCQSSRNARNISTVSYSCVGCTATTSSGLVPGGKTAWSRERLATVVGGRPLGNFIAQGRVEGRP